MVLLAYVVAAFLGMIPITPGGLGFVEAGLVGTLSLAGIGTDQALLATLVYRLASVLAADPHRRGRVPPRRAQVRAAQAHQGRRGGTDRQVEAAAGAATVGHSSGVLRPSTRCATASTGWRFSIRGPL